MEKKKHAQSTIGKKNKTVLDIKLQRDTEKNRLIMELKSCEELEKTISDINGAVRTSTTYRTPEGGYIEFYKKEMDTPERYNAIMKDYVNDYGYRLVGSDKFNVSFLRTKNISDGVEIELPNRISVKDAKTLVKQIEQCAGRIYKTFCKPFVLESSLTERKVM